VKESPPNGNGPSHARRSEKKGLKKLTTEINIPLRKKRQRGEGMKVDVLTPKGRSSGIHSIRENTTGGGD